LGGEDDAAAESVAGGEGAEDEAVAGGEEGGFGKFEMGEAGSAGGEIAIGEDEFDGGVEGGGAGVEAGVEAVLPGVSGVGGVFDGDDQFGGGAVDAGQGDDHAAGDAVGGEIAEVDGATAAGEGGGGLGLVHLNSADDPFAAGRAGDFARGGGEEFNFLAEVDGAGDGDAGDDGAIAGDAEDAFDGHAEGAVIGGAGVDLGDEGLEGGEDVADAVEGFVGDGDDGGVGEAGALEEGAGFGGGGGEAVGGDHVNLGEGDHDAGLAEEADDFHMFIGLGHDAVVGGDDEEKDVDGGGAGDHVADEVAVSGDIDDADEAAVGGGVAGGGGGVEGAGREAEVDAHAAGFFLGEAVGVAAGEGFDEGSFAMIDMAGGADDAVEYGASHARSSTLRSSILPGIAAIWPLGGAKTIECPNNPLYTDGRTGSVSFP
jgi:hypothetical protein